MRNLETEIINFFDVNMTNHFGINIQDTFSSTFSKELKDKIFSGNSEVLRNHLSCNRMMPDSVRAPQA